MGGITVSVGVTTALNASIIAGAAAGFVGGFVGSGGNLSAALSGAAFGGITAGVGSLGLTGTVKVVANGVIAGAQSAVNGGKFLKSFASSFFSQKLSAPSSGNTSNVFSGAIRAAVVAGTSSVIGGGKFANGATTIGFLYLAKGAALNMRRLMIISSRKNPANSSGKSVGFRGDGFKLGGGRQSEYSSKPSLLGGHQGGRGSIGIARKGGGFIIGGYYEPGSFQDHVVEAYAGPHDYLNSWLYDPTSGDIKSGLSAFTRGVGEIVNYLNVAAATPFVAASLIPDNFNETMNYYNAAVYASNN